MTSALDFDPATESLNRHLNRLLTRAKTDPGVEGKNALDMFSAKMLTVEGKVFVLPDNSGDPMMMLVEDAENQIVVLEAEVKRLEKIINDMGGSPVKTKAKAFPWGLYPEVEKRAFEMRFYEKVAPEDIKAWVLSQVPYNDDNSTFINQRFMKGRPSESFGIVVKPADDDSETSWAELWKIGSIQHGTDWMQRVMTAGNGWTKFHKNGDKRRDWNMLDPNKFFTAKNRKHLRHLYYTNGFESAGLELESKVREAGEQGITPTDLKTLGVDMRRLDIAKQNLIFKQRGRWVHHSFAEKYPDNPDARVAVVKFSAASHTTEPSVVV